MQLKTGMVVMQLKTGMVVLGLATSHFRNDMKNEI